MRLVLVEDDTPLRDFLAHAFTAEGLRVEAMPGGPRALARALTGTCDLVILDIGAEDQEGLGMLARLHRERPGLPVLVLSDADALGMKLRAFERGASDYVTKPFSLEELLARARVQLRCSARGAAGGVLRVGDLELDVSRRVARLGEATVALPDREFRLLHFLMQHAGEVVSRQRLLAEIWGYNFDPRSNVVEVCVRRLRRQLGQNAPIRTVRNAGYRAAA